MEKPNLEVIKEIAENDLDFQNSILSILKKEFSQEAEEYENAFRLNNFEETSDIVHKIKHKISLLNLKQGVELAAYHEKELKKGNTDLHTDFKKILNTISAYLYN